MVGPRPTNLSKQILLKSMTTKKSKRYVYPKPERLSWEDEKYYRVDALESRNNFRTEEHNRGSCTLQRKGEMFQCVRHIVQNIDR